MTRLRDRIADLVVAALVGYASRNGSGSIGL